jgi:hypothetical protein
MSPAAVVAVVASGDRVKSPVVVVVGWPTDGLEVVDGGEAAMSETGICH